MTTPVKFRLVLAQPLEQMDDFGFLLNKSMTQAHWYKIYGRALRRPNGPGHSSRKVIDSLPS